MLLTCVCMSGASIIKSITVPAGFRFRENVFTLGLCFKYAFQLILMCMFLPGKYKSEDKQANPLMQHTHHSNHPLGFRAVNYLPPASMLCILKPTVDQASSLIDHHDSLMSAETQ